MEYLEFYGILKAKDEIKPVITEGVGLKTIRIITARHDNLEKAILEWFKQTRSQDKSGWSTV